MAHAGKFWPLAVRRDLLYAVPSYRTAFPKQFRFGVEVDTSDGGLVRYIYDNLLVSEDETPRGICSWTGENATSHGKTVKPRIICPSLDQENQHPNVQMELWSGDRAVLIIRYQPLLSGNNGFWRQSDPARSPYYVDPIFWGGTFIEAGGSACNAVPW